MRLSLYIMGGLLPATCGKLLQKASNRYVICPYYHVVSDKSLPHISPLYRQRTVSEFRADIAWLVDHYEPISWNKVDEYERAKKPAFCLTFDDGFKEFYSVVAPILEEYHIPCVCFLNSAFLDNKDMLSRSKQVLEKQGIQWEEYLRNEQPYMTTAQVQELQQRGFEFGSHSVSHPFYEDLSLKDQLAQTLECDIALRKQIPLKHRLFSFPFGQGHLQPLSIFLQTGMHEMVFGTANMRPASRNMYNRIWMENTFCSARAIIHGEYLREIVHLHLHDK